MKYLISSMGALFFTCANSFSQSATTDIDHNSSDSVVITGSRFQRTAGPTPLGASIITATEIRDAGIDNVNEAIRKLAGVYGRKNTNGTPDASLDLGGFGADSTNNLVILVDGVRLSENEQSMGLLSSIPIDSVARIEIIRGGNSVLYGDGATGGVIQIITKQTGPTPLTGSVSAELGQFDERMGAVSFTRGWEQVNLSINLTDQRSDNYRVNNDLDQHNANVALTWYVGEGRIGLRFDHLRQQFGLPGALTLAQFNQNPRSSLTPFDHGSIALDRYTTFFEQQWGRWQLAAELSKRKRSTKADFVSLQSNVTYSGWQTQFTPRLRYSASLGGMQHEWVMGVDLMNWDRQTESNFSLDYATQQSSAIYFRDEMTIDKARFSFGARREVVDKTSVDPFKAAQDNYDVVQAVNAWELQGSYAFTPVMNLFVKAGQSYRIANVDDNSYTASPNTPLLPQRSHDLELGAELGDMNQQLILRLFQHQLTDELFFDPLANNSLGANTNLDPTRRRGIAVDIKYRLSPHWRISAQAQHVQAVFTKGIYEGKDMILVPKNTLSAHVNWLPDDVQKVYVGAQWVSMTRYGNDVDNACSALIPSHLTVDARYTRKFRDWEWSVAGTNLFNKSYFSTAFGCRSGIYPDDGRQLKLALRYDF